MSFPALSCLTLAAHDVRAPRIKFTAVGTFCGKIWVEKNFLVILKRTYFFCLLYILDFLSILIQLDAFSIAFKVLFPLFPDSRLSPTSCKNNKTRRDTNRPHAYLNPHVIYPGPDGRSVLIGPCKPYC